MAPTLARGSTYVGKLSADFLSVQTDRPRRGLIRTAEVTTGPPCPLLLGASVKGSLAPFLSQRNHHNQG